LAVGLIAALLVTARAPALTLPVEKKVLEIGIIVSPTGVMATGAQLAVNPQEDGLEYFNEEPGIPRVTIEYIWTDCARDRAKFPVYSN